MSSKSRVTERRRELQVIDISNPTKPTWVGGYNTSGSVSDVAVSGDYACVADGDGGLVILRAVINNGAAPSVVIVDGSAEAMLGEWQYISFTSADQATPSVMIDWNDGTPLQTLPLSAGSAWHQYAAPGTHTVTVAPVDKDGGTGAAQARMLSVRAAEVIVDPGDSKKTALFVKGTEAKDIITLVPGTGGQVGMVYNGVGLGFFSFTGRILVHGNGGDDRITIHAKITRTAELHGGNGNDSLTGGAGPDMLVGNAGNDVIKGGNGRNILIGGLGLDKIAGGKNEDLIIAGRYKFEHKIASLAKALKDWNSRLLARAATFSRKTVLDDKAADVLTGRLGNDRFFARTARTVKDKIRDFCAEDVFDI